MKKPNSNSTNAIQIMDVMSPMSDEFVKSIKKFETDIYKKHLGLSKKPTPKSEIHKDPMGFDYVSIAWITDQLNKYFPIWSWKQGSGFKIHDDWVIVDGVLSIIDNGVPREFYSIGAARIQYKRGAPRTPENIIDIDNAAAAAMSAAMKRAVNRLCNIADDVYRRVMNSPATVSSIEKIKSLMNKLDPEKKQLLENYLLEKEELTEAEAQKLIDRLNHITQTEGEKDVNR